MRNSLLLLAAAVLIFGSASVGNAQEWVKLAPEASSFEIMMPGTAKLTEEAGNGTLGPYKTYLYIVRTADTVYLAGYAAYLPSVKLDIKGEIKANRDNFMKSWNEGMIVAEKDITVDGYPGLEFTAQVDSERLATSRILVGGNRPYQIIALTTADADLKNVTKFMNSFKLTRK
ncbi:MAG: hypothetical protein ABIR33_02410 [Pyrinomonadaceae bacterium]